MSPILLAATILSLSTTAHAAEDLTPLDVGVQLVTGTNFSAGFTALTLDIHMIFFYNIGVEMAVGPSLRTSLNDPHPVGGAYLGMIPYWSYQKWAFGVGVELPNALLLAETPGLEPFGGMPVLEVSRDLGRHVQLSGRVGRDLSVSEPLYGSLGLTYNFLSSGGE